MSEQPTFEQLGSRLHWTFPPLISVSLDRWKEAKDGLSAECTIRLGKGVLTQGRLNLSSKVTRTSWIKDLTAQYDKVDWRIILETICLQGIREQRQGEPVLQLTRPDSLLVMPWQVRPFVHTRLHTILFGPGGIGKSYLAIWTAMASEVGLSQLGMTAVQGRALYLDWEMEWDYMQDRCERMRRGCSALIPAEPLYRRCEAPLSDMHTEIAQMIADFGVSYLVIDSLGPACGGDLSSPETAFRFSRALRSLRISALVLAHCAKNTEQRTIFGSIFFENNARSVWEVEGAAPYLTLTHKKHNVSPKQDPMALELIFTDESVSLCEATLDQAQLQAVKSPSRAESTLKTALLEGPKSMKQLEEETSLKHGTVAGTLGKGKGLWCALNRDKCWYLLPE